MRCSDVFIVFGGGMKREELQMHNLCGGTKLAKLQWWNYTRRIFCGGINRDWDCVCLFCSCRTFYRVGRDGA